MAAKAKAAPKDDKLCGQCNGHVVGINHGGFLWPLWMANDNSADFSPHGPRLFNLETNQCWQCAMDEGQTWHR